MVGNSPVFLNIARGSRVHTYMGLKMDEGAAFRYARDYSYMEIPLRGFVDSEGALTRKASRNQHLLIQPACTLRLQGAYKVMVQVNPALQPVASFSSIHILDPGEERQPEFWATFRKDVDADTIPWAVRLYLIA